MAVVKVPAESSKLKTSAHAELDRILNKKPEDKKTEGESEESRRTKSRIRQEQEKAKNLSKTVEELQAELAAKEQELATLKTEADVYKNKVTEYEPGAVAFGKMKRKTIAEIISKLPQEKQAKAKAMAEKLDLEDFKEWVSGYSAPVQQQPEGGKAGDWKTLYENSFKSKEGAEALDAAIQKDASGFDKFMAESKK